MTLPSEPVPQLQGEACMVCGGMWCVSGVFGVVWCVCVMLVRCVCVCECV